MKKIAIFGGTFNPPHVGHLHLAKEALFCGGFDKILVVPDNLPPHKSSDFLVSGKNRLEMCRLAFDDEHFEVSNIELLSSGKSYTINTLLKLQKEYENDELWLIIGSDMLLCFDKWYRYAEILKIVKLCCLSRSDEVSPLTLSKFAEEKLNLCKDRFIIIDTKPLDISSSQIRMRLKSHEDVKNFLSPKVLEYIKANGLYS